MCDMFACNIHYMGGCLMKVFECYCILHVDLDTVELRQRIILSLGVCGQRDASYEGLTHVSHMSNECLTYVSRMSYTCFTHGLHTRRNFDTGTTGYHFSTAFEQTTSHESTHYVRSTV